MIAELPLPPTVNHMYRKAARGRGLYKTDAASTWTYTALLMWRLATGGQTITGNVEVRIQIHSGRGDIDNRVKPVLDMLQEAGVFTNDSKVARIVVERTAQRTQTVTVEALPYVIPKAQTTRKRKTTKASRRGNKAA